MSDENELKVESSAEDDLNNPVITDEELKLSELLILATLWMLFGS